MRARACSQQGSEIIAAEVEELRLAPPYVAATHIESAPAVDGHHERPPVKSAAAAHGQNKASAPAATEFATTNILLTTDFPTARCPLGRHVSSSTQKKLSP
jgi:hypothetical protein